jgi:hypothetical protein
MEESGYMGRRAVLRYCVGRRTREWFYRRGRPRANVSESVNSRSTTSRDKDLAEGALNRYAPSSGHQGVVASFRLFNMRVDDYWALSRETDPAFCLMALPTRRLQASGTAEAVGANGG